MTRYTLQHNYLPAFGPHGPGGHGGGVGLGAIIKVEDYSTIVLVYSLEHV